MKMNNFRRTIFFHMICVACGASGAAYVPNFVCTTKSQSQATNFSTLPDYTGILLNPELSKMRRQSLYYDKSSGGSPCVIYSSGENAVYRSEVLKYQNVQYYGHPWHCPERRRSFFAQPQYGGVNLQNYTSSPIMPVSKPLGTWAFRGSYYFATPGRTGNRHGNPTYITSSETLYIKQMSDQGLFTAGSVNSSGVRNLNIEETEGVWYDCTSNGWKSAQASFLGAAVNDDDTYGLTYNYYPNGSTITFGPKNRYTRLDYSFDEGWDTFQHPYNPWSFQLSFQFPTYFNTTNMTSNITDADFLPTCQYLLSKNNSYTSTTCKNIVISINRQWNAWASSSLGYSPTNFFDNNGYRQNFVTGSWEENIMRGMHVHQPPENWGSSFEPTRALGPLIPGWQTDNLRNWTQSSALNFTQIWSGILAFVNEPVTMSNSSIVDANVRNRTFLRYKAPHVQNQPSNCPSVSVPTLKLDFGQNATQPIFGCNNSCQNGCVANLPSMLNPGPSFTSVDGVESVELVRVHKASAHFTCVRLLLMLKKQHSDPETNTKLRHQYALARVIMKPKPGSPVTESGAFINNILTGSYATQPIGYWQEWQTGTIGLRSMDPGNSGPSPQDLKFSGVTSDNMQQVPFQMDCWDASCVGQTVCTTVC